jgi:hypothetical protein
MRRRLVLPALLLGINVPDDVVRKAEDAIAGSFGHLRETFCLGLILECVGGKVDA